MGIVEREGVAAVPIEPVPSKASETTITNVTVNPAIPEGSIWERDDELFIVEKVYEAHRKSQPSEGTMPALVPMTLVKFRCIDPMPRHTEVHNFTEHYHPYDPEAE